MTMIYYASGFGGMDVAQGEIVLEKARYPVIRGYDTAGNLLSTIYYDQVPAREYIDPDFTHQTRYEVTGLFDRYGDAQDPAISINSVPHLHPQAIAADAVGHLYVASSSLNFQENDGPILYADFFRKYRRNGDRIPFPQLHGGAIEAVALDPSDGSIYVGGASVISGFSLYSLRKYDSAGNLLWSAGSDVAEPKRYYVLDIVLDASGDVYTRGEYNSTFGEVGSVSNYCRLAKYSGSDGSLIWRRWIYDFSTRNRIVLYDGVVYFAVSGKFYCVDALATPPSTIESADSTTVVAYERVGGAAQKYWITQWDMSDGSFLGGIGQPTEDATIVATYFLAWCPLNEQLLLVLAKDPGYPANWTYHIARYEPDLTLTSEAALTHYLAEGTATTGIRVDSAGNRYFIAGRVIATLGSQQYIPYDSIYGAYHLHAFDADDNSLWDNLNALGTPGAWYQDSLPEWPDTDNLGWTIGEITSTGTYRAMHDAYDNIPDFWAVSSIAGGGTNWAIVDVAIIEDTENPALALPVSFGLATWLGDLYSRSPALALSLLLSPPRWLREFAAAFKPQTIYRLFLTGDSGPVELPLKSISCRRETGGIDLTVICPNPSSAQVAAIQARTEGELIVYTGLRFTNGTEQLDELLRAPFAGLRLDKGASSQTVTLTGSAAETAEPQTRPLQGISYRNRIAGGGERVRCAVDTYLRVGDTAQLSLSESWTVAEITYFIDSGTAFMEVAR